MYNYIGLEPRREAMHWQFGEMKLNTSNWSNFGMLLRRAGLTASAGLSCLNYRTKLITVALLILCCVRLSSVVFLPVRYVLWLNGGS